MSEQSGGSGWWQASDGLWYSPEQHPDHRPPQFIPPPPPPPVVQSARWPATPAGRGCLYALVAAVCLAVFAGVLTSLSGSSNSGTGPAPGNFIDTTTTVPDSTPVLFPGRVDAQKEDQERNIGEAAMLSGYTSTVSAAEFRPSISSYQDSGYVEIDVTILNRDDKAQSFSTSDWRLQTPNGEVLDPTYGVDGELDSGDLVHGGTVSGKVAFEVGARKGDFFIIYKPDPFDAARGIWKVTVT